MKRLKRETIALTNASFLSKWKKGVIESGNCAILEVFNTHGTDDPGLLLAADLVGNCAVILLRPRIAEQGTRAAVRDWMERAAPEVLEVQTQNPTSDAPKNHCFQGRPKP